MDFRKPVKKNFDDKEFIYWNTYHTKSSAENVANSMREIGDLARIIHTQEAK